MPGVGSYFGAIRGHENLKAQVQVFLVEKEHAGCLSMFAD